MDKPEFVDTEIRDIVANKWGLAEFEVIDQDVEMLGEWIGLCGDHALLNLKIKNQEDMRQISFFVKVYPKVELIIEFIENTGSFKKEIFIYKLFDLFRKEGIYELLNDCIPSCYLTKPKKFLVLENLTDLGYTQLNKYDLLDYETLDVVLQALSKLHASSLVYEETKSCRLLDQYAEELEDSYFNDNPDFPFRKELNAAFLGLLNSIQLFSFPEKLVSGKGFRSVLKSLCENVFNLAKPSKKFRNVICHGDIWATNLLIKYEQTRPVKCKLVDFQCARYTPPVQDLMSVIYLTTSREFRQKYMYSLIGVYYTYLEKRMKCYGIDLKTIIPFEEFLESCEEQKAFGLVQAGVYFPLILMPSDVVQEYFENREANEESLRVDRSIFVKEYMDKNENYRSRIEENLKDLKEYCDLL